MGKIDLKSLQVSKFDLWLETIKTFLITYGVKLLIALVIVIVGRIAIKIIRNILKKMFTKLKVEDTLSAFLINIVSGLLHAFLVIAVLGQIGIDTTSFVAIIGAAGLAVGFALQGSLASFAAGVLIILLKPFKLGDFITAGGESGTVVDISIFSTRLNTPDNKAVIVPNTDIMGGSITNYSRENRRRIDLVIGVGYDDDLKKVEAIFKKILDADERILKDPAYTIGVLELGDNSVNFAVRPWVATSDYWPTYFDLMRKIKLTLDANGVSIPYPQRDVHVHYPEKDAKQIEEGAI